ncbi:MAG: peptidoglycan recognition protein family protein [Micromonosporaceae bacterium]
MAQSPEYPDLRWIPPRSYTKGRPSHDCSATGITYPGGARFITVHYTAGAEGYDDAEQGALYDQRRTDGTSAHYYVDADSVVQCVRTTDRAHTALFHGNMWGLHYELCGTRQSRSEWLDTVSRRTIRNAARQMARDMDKYSIPLTRLTDRELRARTVKGVCGHADWTDGWPEDGGSHTDPGGGFPWDVLFDDIASFREDDMPIRTSLGKSKIQSLAWGEFNVLKWDVEHSDSGDQHADGDYPGFVPDNTSWLDCQMQVRITGLRPGDWYQVQYQLHDWQDGHSTGEWTEIVTDMPATDGDQYAVGAMSKHVKEGQHLWVAVAVFPADGSGNRPVPTAVSGRWTLRQDR